MDLLDDLLLDEPDAEALILGLLRVADRLRAYGAGELCDSSPASKIKTLSAANTLIVLKRFEDYDKDHPEEVDPVGEGFRIGEVTPSHLAEALVRTPGNLSQLFLKLVPDYIKLRQINGRKKAVSLTHKGRLEARKLEDKHSGMVGTVCAGLSKKSIQQSFRTLDALYLAVGEKDGK